MADDKSDLASRNMQGGFWNSQPSPYSKQTHDLLKDMMRESKLTNFQQRHLGKAMRGGTSLPVKCLPTTSEKPKIPRVPPPPSKVIDTRNYSGGVRTLDTMQNMGAFERPNYRPPARYTRSAKEKEKLANIMAYGKDIPPPTNKQMRKRAEPKEEPEIDRFEELQAEIDDRQNFLASMEAAGQGDQYRTIIATEISQKIREMEVLDKKRTEDLQKRIRENEKMQKTTAIPGS